MRIEGRGLFISAFFPSADVPAAGNRLASAALAEFVSRHAVVDLVTFRNQSERRLGSRLLDDGRVTAYIADVSWLDRLIASVVFPLLPAGVAVRKYLARRYVAKLLRTYKYEEIFIDFTQAVEALPRALRGNATLRIHDIITELYERQKSNRNWIVAAIGWVEHVKTARWERVALSEIGSLQALSHKDAQNVGRIAGREDCSVRPPTNFYIVTGRTEKTVIPYTLLFWANFARPENVDAAEFFSNDIFPSVLNQLPASRLILAGAHPPRSAVGRRKQGVEWTGFVESPDALFRSCGVGIVPLRYGAGVKIKTLEFLHSGIATVSTAIGAEGVSPHKLLFICDDPSAFADKCVEIMRQADERLRS